MKLAKAVSALASLLLASSALAASWSEATEIVFTSSDGHYLFHVVPRILEMFRERPGHLPGPDGIPSIYGVTGTCYGTLLSFRDGYYRPVWRGALANRVSPNYAMPANDGSAVVTLGNYANIGNEDHLIAVYGRDGALLSKFKLEDIYTADEIAAIPESTAGKAWAGKRYIDTAKHLFIMELFGGRRLRINLLTGQLVSATE